MVYLILPYHYTRVDIPKGIYSILEYNIMTTLKETNHAIEDVSKEIVANFLDRVERNMATLLGKADLAPNPINTRAC